VQNRRTDSTKAHFSFRGLVNSSQHVEQRCLSAPREAEDNDEFAPLDRKRNASKYQISMRVCLGSGEEEVRTAELELLLDRVNMFYEYYLAAQ
jgi:hypothetical protein